MWIWEGTRRGRGVKLCEYTTGCLCVHIDDLTMSLDVGDVSLRAATVENPVDSNDAYASIQIKQSAQWHVRR